jgi:hypothetical protein
VCQGIFSTKIAIGNSLGFQAQIDDFLLNYCIPEENSKMKTSGISPRFYLEITRFLPNLKPPHTSVPPWMTLIGNNILLKYAPLEEGRWSGLIQKPTPPLLPSSMTSFWDILPIGQE